LQAAVTSLPICRSDHVNPSTETDVSPSGCMCAATKLLPGAPEEFRRSFERDRVTHRSGLSLPVPFFVPFLQLALDPVLLKSARLAVSNGRCKSAVPGCTQSRLPPTVSDIAGGMARPASSAFSSASHFRARATCTLANRRSPSPRRGSPLRSPAGIAQFALAPSGSFHEDALGDAFSAVPRTARPLGRHD